jgi:hypothetical protein
MKTPRGFNISAVEFSAPASLLDVDERQEAGRSSFPQWLPG